MYLFRAGLAGGQAVRQLCPEAGQEPRVLHSWYTTVFKPLNCNKLNHTPKPQNATQGHLPCKATKVQGDGGTEQISQGSPDQDFLCAQRSWCSF
jgi:hypothetical protein